MFNVKISPIDNSFTVCLWQVLNQRGVAVAAGINASRESAIKAAFAAREKAVR